ncbi:MMPL family transporter [Pseudomonas matsuisoli]|uniref:Membrane protein n=1 Tax=Pseudomonas matsuisoli TaxID=1515666 RepID=A0A917PYB4_9PSED|nr:MMPL family transporter [Pseudomonas matsuisoli]GGJ99081.1 membrane protein [Pseudomonas matsuisoli]
MTSNVEAARRQRWPFAACLAALLALLALAGWQWRAGAPVSTDLLQLLPHSSTTPLAARAEARMQAAVNRDVVLLIRHEDSAIAKALAADIGQAWAHSARFATVQWNLETDLPAVRRQLLDGRLALLSPTDRALIQSAPARFVEERVGTLLDPVGVSIVPPEQDWFGFATRAQQSLPRPGNVTADLDGSLIAEHDGQSWMVLRAQTQGSAFDGDLPAKVAADVEQARTEVRKRGGQAIAASGLLYAAGGAEQARREISLIGGLSGVATIALLWALFRRLRMLLAVVPVVIGLLTGITTCVALYGTIHVLTLVLGASLIGVAVDYPLHVLSKSWALRPWNLRHALRLTWPGLTLGLITNVIGYLALAFTPLPALTQVAAFSAAGLIGAYLATLFLLPALIGREPIEPWSPPLRWAERLLAWHVAFVGRVGTPLLLIGLLAFCALGASRLSLHDDIRQWISRSPALQAEAIQVAQVTGFQPTSQFLLVTAADETELLTRLAGLRPALDRLVGDGVMTAYLSLDQLVAPAPAQDAVRSALPELLAASAPFQGLGVDPRALEAEAEKIEKLPSVTVDAALAGPLGEPWRPLWLGHDDNGVAAIISVQGLTDSSRLADLAKTHEGIQAVDRLAELNGMFSDTQRSAAVLKLLACALIFGLLCRPFGPKGAARIVAISLLAALCSLACLGWLGMPLTLFGLFGLLLVTAIGVDYAILLRERVGGLPVSLLGTLLSAITTWLSFGLLALSDTPAVSSFGITVTLGLIFNFLLAPWAAETQKRAL